MFRGILKQLLNREGGEVRWGGVPWGCPSVLSLVDDSHIYEIAGKLRKFETIDHSELFSN